MSSRTHFAVIVAVAFVALGAALLVPHLRAETSEAAVSRLQYSQGCLRDGRVSIYLLWSGGNNNPRQQWIDLSTENNGWLPGTFISAGPFGPNAQSFDWNGLVPTTRHYVRINQMLQNTTWDTSPTFVVETPNC
jgi:hypothetical protein